MRSSSRPRNLNRKKSIRMMKFVSPGEKSSWMMALTCQSLILGLRHTCSTFCMRLGRCTSRPWEKCHLGMSRLMHGSVSADRACLHGRWPLCVSSPVPTATRKHSAPILWLQRLAALLKLLSRQSKDATVCRLVWLSNCALSGVARMSSFFVAGGAA